MFLRNTGASGRFTFDVIYSCFQKSLRKGEMELAFEMAKEFANHPNALKKRLIYCCCEDCPNLYLIRDIFNTEPILTDLIKYIPIICNHIKCHEVINTFRAACQADYLKEDFDWEHDTVWTACRKLYFKLCQNGLDVNAIIRDIQTHCPALSDTKQWRLLGISNAINKTRTILYAIIVFNLVPYMNVENYEIFDEPNKIPKCLKFNHKFDILPDYVYDKHVSSSKAEHKTYEYFITTGANITPRMPETQHERLGTTLYLKTNMASGLFIKPIENEHNPALKLAKDVLTAEEFELLNT